MQSAVEIRTDNLSNRSAHPVFRSSARSSTDPAEAIDLIGTSVAFARNAQIYGEGEASTYLYKLTSGLARSYRMTSEGRRQIVAFYVPGDIFGFESGNQHTLSAEATTDSRACVIKRSAVINAMSRDEDIARELWLNMHREICHGQEHILQFSRPARARVANFLIEMVQRFATGNAKTLAISRQDIADYLDLRIETVSRAMTRLAGIGAITPCSRCKITIGDPEALHRIADAQIQTQ